MKGSIPGRLAAAGICFALTFLFSSATLPLGLSPFSFGVYTSCLVLGGGYLTATIPYLLARLLATRSLAPFLRALFAAAGVGIVLLPAKLMRRKIHPFYAIISAFFTQLFTLFLLPGEGYLPFFADLALSTLFALALLRPAMRRGRGSLRGESGEKAVSLLLAFAFGASAYGTSLFGVTPYYLFVAILLPLSARASGEGSSFPFAYALGAIASGAPPLILLPVAVGWVLCLACKGERRISAFLPLVTEGVLFFLTGRPFSPFNFPLLLSGGLLVAFLPEGALPFSGRGTGGGEAAARALVNKARLDLSGKIGCVGEALRKMSDGLSVLGGEEALPSVAERLSAQFARAMCEGCAGYKDCAAQGGEGTAPLLSPTIERALERGRATLADLSPYLKGNCRKIDALIEGLNDAALLYGQEKEGEKVLRAERERMAREAEGIAGILDVLKRDTRRVVTFDGKRERCILAELEREGIAACDVMVAEEGENLGVTLSMPERYAEDPRVTATLSRALGILLIPESVSAIGAGMVSASYEPAPLYDAIVGQSVRIKEGSEACGDTKTVTRLRGDKILVALSDGMGSGKEANLGSSAAIALVENLYRTGVEERVLLPLINRLLTMRNDGSFQTLDMCVVNLRSGEADFIKLSAPESVIKRKEGSEIVEGGALPLGILGEVKPSISRRKLSSGEVVVMMTDGVTDAIGADGVVRVLESGKTNNPQTVADNVVRDASYVSAADDQTVLALRLFRRL